MEEVTKFGVMAVFMKDTGKMIKLTETVDLFMQMEIIMKVSGRTTRPTDSENIHIQMAQNMKAFGLMINSMDRVRKNGQMALNMKETINMGKKMGSVSFYGPTCHLIKEISTIIISMVTVNTSGLMEENIQVTGYVIKCMEKDFLLGMTATPERSDGADVFRYFDYNIAYEIRLHHALELQILCPFHYFGVADLAIDGDPAEE
jgi:hypothetical protein